MENFTEIKKDQFENVYGLYINNPNRESFFVYMGNNKNEDKIEITEENMTYYLQLISSLIADYFSGEYRNIPIKTIIYLSTTLYCFLSPKKRMVDKIPFVKLVKKAGLITMVVNSFRHDLENYAIWKSTKEKIEEI